MNTKILYADKGAVTVTYGNTEYRIQEDRGYRHIVVRVDGVRTKITVKERKWDLFFWYVLEGLEVSHPCPVMDWWMKMRVAGKYLSIKNKTT